MCFSLLLELLELLLLFFQMLLVLVLLVLLVLGSLLEAVVHRHPVPFITQLDG